MAQGQRDPRIEIGPKAGGFDFDFIVAHGQTCCAIVPFRVGS